MSSRIILILASTFLLAGSSCSMFGSAPDSGPETADSAAKKDADNIATDTGIDGATSPSGDGSAADGSKPLNAAEKSLYDRLGGKETLVKFSSRFIDAMASNPKLLANPKIAEGMKKDQSKHKSGMADYLCQISGGPCKYNGPSMKDAHKGFGVTADEWKVMGGIFIKTLREMNVGKNERKELANLASMSKPDIVGGGQ